MLKRDRYHRVPTTERKDGEKLMVEMVAAMGRLGTETAFEVLARANKLSAEGKDVINLGIGQPDFKTPDHLSLIHI